MALCLLNEISRNHFTTGGAIMVKNVGGVDQKIRLLLGILALGIAALAGLPTWGTIVLGTVGVIALVTGSTGFCPLWTVFGINTCSLKGKT